MKIETKYDVGEAVITLHNNNPENVVIEEIFASAQFIKGAPPKQDVSYKVLRPNGCRDAVKQHSVYKSIEEYKSRTSAIIMADALRKVKEVDEKAGKFTKGE